MFDLVKSTKKVFCVFSEIFPVYIACMQTLATGEGEKKETTKSAQRREFSCFSSHDRYVIFAKILRNFERASPKKLCTKLS